MVTGISDIHKLAVTSLIKHYGTMQGCAPSVKLGPVMKYSITINTKQKLCLFYPDFSLLLNNKLLNDLVGEMLQMTGLNENTIGTKDTVSNNTLL